jgi:sulfate/thiosulfate transport system ATP-binding protein
MSIILEQLTKRYDGIPVVNNVSLEIGDGEFFVLLGSSGSGKTTILSIIAGLTPLDHGRVLLHGREVTHLPPQQRRVGFVFQNYALFQHMTVGENVEFGLSVRRVAAQQRHRRRDELLELVGLAGLGGRLPRQLSGGQQQRVALARALACDPEILLLDEPLGALDAKIRVELRRTLKAIQRRLGIAAILVTHDQEEAFDLADRLGVMSFGRLLEVGQPQQLYQTPQTEFVSTFLGAANLLVGQASRQGVQLGSTHFSLPPENGRANGGNRLGGDSRRVQVLFRPEDVALAPEPEQLDCPRLGQAEVEETSFGGSYERLRLRLPPLPGVRPVAPPVAFGSKSILVDVTRSPEEAARFPLQPGDHAWTGLRRIHPLAQAGLNILILTDGSLRSVAALEAGGQIARLAHARVLLLGCGREPAALEAHLAEARKSLGSGLAALQVRAAPELPAAAVARVVEQQPFDLVVMGFRPQEDMRLAEQILSCGEHHLWLACGPQAAPSKALVAVARGEPGKEDIFFTGRLAAHLGAEVSLLSVIAPGRSSAAQQEQADRFLENGVQTLGLLHVPAKGLVRTGQPAEEILTELKSGGYGLLVLGAPLAYGKPLSFEGVLSQTLAGLGDHSCLIVRARNV